MTYISGFVTPVPSGNKDAYVAKAKLAWPLFKEYGALQTIEGWGTFVPEGEMTDFRRAVALKEGETVVLSWVLWPDRATADACAASYETDERWQQVDMPFDGSRMIFGGFDAVFEASK